MFVLVRSFVCIGFVVAALPAPGTGLPKADVIASLSPSPETLGATAESLCGPQLKRCAPLLVRAMTRSVEGSRPHVRMRPSADSLRAADRQVDWATPSAIASR